MSFRKYLLASASAFLAMFFVYGKSIAQQKKADFKKYFVSNSGDDNNLGTIDAPFKTIQKVNNLHLEPGTQVYFKGGDIFKGTLIIGADKAGTKKAAGGCFRPTERK